MCAAVAIVANSTVPLSAGLLLAGIDTVLLPLDIRALIGAAVVTPTANGPTASARAPTLKIK
jgi:hypothetical protein